MSRNTNLSMDGRESLYSKIFLPETPVSIPEYNWSSHTDSVVRAKNYNNKSEDMEQNDIHNEFTDYIIRSAVVHKNLDKSAESGTRLQSIRDTVSRNAQCVSYSSLYGGALSVRAPTGEQFTKDGEFIKNKNDQTDKISKKLNINVENTSELESVVLRTINTIEENKKNVIKYSDISDYIELDDHVSDFVNSFKTNILSNNNFIDTINNNKYNLVTKDNNGVKLQNGGSAPTEITNNYYNNNGELRNMKDSTYSIKYLFDEFKNSNSSLYNINESVKDSISNISENVEKKVAKNTVKEYINNINNGFEGETLIKETFNNMSKTMPKYGKLLENSTMEVIKSKIVPEFPSQHINVESNETVNSFFKDVIKNTDKNTGINSNIYSNLFDVLENDSVVNISDYGTLTGGSNVRINMKKVSKGSNETVFEQFIPEIENANKLFYTDSNGHVQSVEISQNEHSKNILKDIYRNVYNSKNSESLNISTKSGTNLLNVPNTMKNTTQKNKFDINISKIIKDTINNSPLKLQQGGKKLTEKYTDLVTGNIVNINNNIPLKISTTGRKQIYQCLLDDDSNTLDTCIESYRMKGFNESINNEIKNINPLIAEKTLRKFGFKTIQNGGSKYIESADEWMNSFMTENFSQEQINELKKSQKNKYLITYFNELSSLVNSQFSQQFGGSNPTEQSTTSGPEKIDLFKTNLKSELQKLHDMLNKLYSYEFNDFINNHVDNVLLIPPVFYIDPSQYYSYVPMNGGTQQSELYSSELKSLFYETLNTLNIKGKTLNEENRKTIEENITKLGQLEHTILLSIATLRKYIDCIKTYGDYTDDQTVISLDTLRDLIKQCLEQKQTYYEKTIDILDLQKVLQSIDNSNFFPYPEAQPEESKTNTPVVATPDVSTPVVDTPYVSTK